MSSAVFRSVQEYQAAVGQSYGPTDWLLVDQHRINLFAEATGDHQWIHVDPERAAARALRGHDCPRLPVAVAGESTSCRSWCGPKACATGINYGCDRVRFPAALRSGSRVRGRAQILAAEDLGGGALQAKIRVTLEAEGVDKPVCVADTLSRLYF